MTKKKVLRRILAVSMAVLGVVPLVLTLRFPIFQERHRFAIAIIYGLFIVIIYGLFLVVNRFDYSKTFKNKTKSRARAISGNQQSQAISSQVEPED